MPKLGEKRYTACCEVSSIGVLTVDRVLAVVCRREMCVDSGGYCAIVNAITL